MKPVWNERTERSKKFSPLWPLTSLPEVLGEEFHRTASRGHWICRFDAVCGSCVFLLVCRTGDLDDYLTIFQLCYKNRQILSCPSKQLNAKEQVSEGTLENSFFHRWTLFHHQHRKLPVYLLFFTILALVIGMSLTLMDLTWTDFRDFSLSLNQQREIQRKQPETSKYLIKCVRFVLPPCSSVFFCVFLMDWTFNVMWRRCLTGNDVWVASLGQYRSEYLQQL